MSKNTQDRQSRTFIDSNSSPDHKMINKKDILHLTKNAKENAITLAHKELFLNVKQNRDLIQNKRNVSQKIQDRKKAEVKSRQNKIEVQSNKPFYDLNNSFIDDKPKSKSNMIRKNLVQEFEVNNKKNKDILDKSTASKNSTNLESNLNNKNITDNYVKTKDNQNSHKKNMQKLASFLQKIKIRKSKKTSKDENTNTSIEDLKSTKKQNQYISIDLGVKKEKSNLNDLFKKSQELDGIRIQVNLQKAEAFKNLFYIPDKKDSYFDKNKANNIFNQKEKSSYIKHFIKEIQSKNKEFLNDHEFPEKKNLHKKIKVESSQLYIRSQEKSYNESLIYDLTAKKKNTKLNKSDVGIDDYLQVNSQPPINSKSQIKENRNDSIVIDNYHDLTPEVIAPYYPIFKPRKITEEGKNWSNQENYVYDLSRDKFKVNNRKEEFVSIAKKIARGKLINLNKSFDCVKEKLPSFSNNEIPKTHNLDYKNELYNKNWFPSLKFSSKRIIKNNDYTILSDGSKVVKEVKSEVVVDSGREILYNIKQSPIISYKKIKEVESNYKNRPKTKSVIHKVEPKVIKEKKDFVATLNSWKVENGSVNTENENFDQNFLKTKQKQYFT